MKRLSFEDFVASKVEVTPKMASIITGAHEDYFKDALKVLMYAESLHINVVSDSKYHLVLENQDWLIGNLHELEERLYNFGVNEYFERPMEVRIKEVLQTMYIKDKITNIREERRDELYYIQLEGTDDVEYLLGIQDDMVHLSIYFPKSFLDDE